MPRTGENETALTIYMTEDDKEAFRVAAAKAGVSMSTYLREAGKARLERERRENGAQTIDA